MQWIFDSAGGRKMTLALVGLVCITVLGALGTIDGTTAVETIKWVILGVAGALAVSDVGAGIAARTEKPADPGAAKPPEPSK